MEDNQLNEAYLVVVPVLDDKNILVGSGIQVMDDVLVDPDAEENFVAAPGKSHVIMFLCSNKMAIYDVVMRSLEDGSVECACRHFFVFKSGREITLKARAKQSKKYGHCEEKTNKHTKTTYESNLKYIAKLSRIVMNKRRELMRLNKRLTLLEYHIMFRFASFISCFV
ncbi:hypothetical protein Tco_1538232 [Tanacetum coccineum]